MIPSGDHKGSRSIHKRLNDMVLAQSLDEVGDGVPLGGGRVCREVYV